MGWSYKTDATVLSNVYKYKHLGAEENEISTRNICAHTLTGTTAHGRRM